MAIVHKPTNSLIRREELFAPINEFFDQVFRDHYRSFANPDFFKAGGYPKLDIIEYPDRLELRSEIAGLTKEDVKIEYDAPTHVLSISGSKQQDNPEKDGGTYVYRELKHSAFCRSFRLPDDLDTDNISAEFKDGLLKLVLPRKEVKPQVDAPKVITIK